MKQEHSQFARTYPPQATNYHFDGTPETLLDLSGPKSTLHPVGCLDLLVSIQKIFEDFFFVLQVTCYIIPVHTDHGIIRTSILGDYKNIPL